MHKRLTDRTLKTLKPAKAGKRYDVMDGDVRGLGVRVTDRRHIDPKVRPTAALGRVFESPLFGKPK